MARQLLRDRQWAGGTGEGVETIEEKRVEMV
jgi:hypothetical protein